MERTKMPQYFYILPVKPTYKTVAVKHKAIDFSITSLPNTKFLFLIYFDDSEKKCKN